MEADLPLKLAGDEQPAVDTLKALVAAYDDKSEQATRLDKVKFGGSSTVLVVTGSKFHPRLQRLIIFQ